MERSANPASKAAGVALICDKSVLLAKRAEFYNGEPVPFGGYWSIFGGAIEPDESPMLCAVRELEEESKISISTTDLKFIKRFIDDFSEFIFYVCEVPDLISPVLNYEHTEYGWFNIDHLDNFPELIDLKIVECINLYKTDKFIE